LSFQPPDVLIATWQQGDATVKETYPATSLETAACLWEAVLEILNGGAGHKGLRAQAQRIRENMGTSGLRLAVLRWTELVDADWAKVKDEYDQPFDWEFVPEWIAQNIDWSGETPVYKIGGRA
jgi:hypothetical protein